MARLFPEGSAPSSSWNWASAMDSVLVLRHGAEVLSNHEALTRLVVGNFLAVVIRRAKRIVVAGRCSTLSKVYAVIFHRH